MITPALSMTPTLLAQPVTPPAPPAPSGVEPTGFERALNSEPANVARRLDEIGQRNAGVLELGARSAELNELVRQIARDGVQPTPAELFLIQSELSQVQFGLEMTSKVVEHATSGAKSALQTQM